MARYNCLLIDLDNTLLNFDEGSETALRETMQHFGLPVTPEVLAQYHTANHELWTLHDKGQITRDRLMVLRFEKLLESVGMQGDAAAINAWYLDGLSRQAVLIPGADEFLEEIAEVATIGIITNGVAPVQEGRIRLSGLAGFFDDVFISDNLGCQKPQRKFFDLALKKLGVANREKVLVIGDSLSADIQGGINAELDTCWYNPASAENPEGIQPTYTVFGFEEMKPIIYGEDGAPDNERKERHRNGT